MDTELLMQPLIQYGFLGMSGILLVIIVWLIKQLLDVIKKNNEVITRNTDIITSQNKALTDNQNAIWALRDKILARPCIAIKEDK